MIGYNLWFLLLMPFKFCPYSKGEREQQQKTIRKDADFTPVCSNSTQNLIIYVNCKIKPAGSREEECHLTFQHNRGFEQKCDSRFSLLLLNQTIFLELKNLTPENIGNYTCQCSKQSGTFTLKLNITVEDDAYFPPAETTFSSNLLTLIAVLVLIAVILSGVISACICRKKCHRKHLDPWTWDELKSKIVYKEAAEVEPHRPGQKEMGVYSIVNGVCCDTINQ